jgi:RNA polymerase sigma-70 factor (ECF subfamily)
VSKKVEQDHGSLYNLAKRWGKSMMHAIQAMPEVKADSSVDLLLKAQSGDDDALNRLLARYLPRLKRWASGRLPSGLRTMLDTGDLVQDAVINSLRHLNTLEIRTEGALQAYLRRAVNNRITDLYRRAGRRQTRGEMPEEIVAAGTSPLEAAIGAEALENYERALASLNDAERQAIVLRVELGLNFEEMATQLGKPSADAARMAVTRAITRLAAEMRRAS